MKRIQQDIARVLVDIGAVRFTPDAPVTFKSGLVSPVYVDNRIIPYHPTAWKNVIVAFHEHIHALSISFDIVAGIATGGVPHSSVLGYTLRKPSVFVRKEAKDYGTQQRIEGGDVEGKRILLIEDLVTTGSSSLSGIAALQEAGAIVEDCMAIVSYGFEEAREAFTSAGIRLQTLTSFSLILNYARENPDTRALDLDAIEDWFKDPHNWAQRHGHS